MTLELLIFGLLIGTCFFIVIYVISQKMNKPKSRLFPEDRPTAMITEKKERFIIPPNLSRKFLELLGLSKDPLKVKELKKKLTMAGHYGDKALSTFGTLKILAPVLTPMVVFPLLLAGKVPTGMIGIFGYLSILLGFFLPNLILNHQIQGRQKKIMSGLPDALDLLVVCVEAGLGLDAAMKRVAEDFKSSCPVLSQEFIMVNLEINAGLERQQALRNLSERTGVEELTTLCAILIQADRFGTSIAQALRVQSDTMRTNRRQKLEELANKTPVKLVFPLLLFIFPAVMVVIIGPGAIKVYEAFIKK
jgi:tight adherence protein C